MQLLRPLSLAALLLLAAGPARAADCTGTSTGLVPLTELGTGSYFGFEGGLYPGGTNALPGEHLAEGLARAGAVTPRLADGTPWPTGRYVLLSIGMSNTSEEFCSSCGCEPCSEWTFAGQARAHPDVDRTHLAIANGALWGQVAELWDEPDDPNYDRVADEVLAPRFLTEAQVQVVWVKLVNPHPTVSLPVPAADAYSVLERLGGVVRAVKTRYPNVQQVLLSSRIYGGYASTTTNPEPMAYETGFAVKWLIESQLEQMQGAPPDPRAGDLRHDGPAPWLAWGPYLWADGLTPRADGLSWSCDEFEADDGTHPSQLGEQKVGALLLDFMLESPLTAPWFRAAPASPAPTLPRIALVLLGAALAVAVARYRGRSLAGSIRG